MAGKAGSVYLGFRSPQSEAFHGFGGRREGTDLRGSDIKAGCSTTAIRTRPPPTTLRFPVHLIAWLWPAAEGDRISRWRMASDRPTAWRVSRPGGSMEMTLTSGGQARAMAGISRLTGRHRLPPAWATGPFFPGRSGSPRTPVANTSRGSSQILNIWPARISRSRPTPSKAGRRCQELRQTTIRTLKEEGIHPVLYLRSFVSNDTAGTEGPRHLRPRRFPASWLRPAGRKPFLCPRPSRAVRRR